MFSAFLNRKKAVTMEETKGTKRSKGNSEEVLKNWVIHIDKVLAINTLPRHNNE